MKKTLMMAAIAMLCRNQASAQNVFPATGNVGIGTNAPQALLHVVGDVKVDSSLQILENLTVEGKSVFRSGVRLHEGIYVSGNSSINDTIRFSSEIQMPNLAVPTNPDVSLMLIDNTTSGVKKVPAMDFITGISQVLYSLQCLSDTAGNVANPLWQNGPNKIYTACEGINVGIGTSAPAYPLHVRGKGYFQNGIRFGLATPTTQTASNQAWIEGEVNNGRPLMRLSRIGGSGDPTTVFRVENDGVLYCTKVNILAPVNIPVPDYVFRPGYELMSLEQVHKYVSYHQHLPGIPSEEEIRKEGIAIGEMQLKLLQKIEELTLYLIDQQEKNKAQDELIQKLQDELSQKH